jgi:hypothetical protein
MWAFGVMLFTLIYGRLPFRGASYMAVKHAVLHDALHFPPAAPHTREWGRLCEQLLIKDPNKRLTASQLSLCTLLFDATRAVDDDDARPLAQLLAPSPSVAHFATMGLGLGAAPGSPTFMQAMSGAPDPVPLTAVTREETSTALRKPVRGNVVSFSEALAHDLRCLTFETLPQGGSGRGVRPRNSGHVPSLQESLTGFGQAIVRE